MKKILIFAGIFILSGLLFTGFSPSVDGRAVVAEKGELPSGLFGKTVGYLPGDSVSVVNPANGKTVDILVLGSLDPSQGVAILLSPEAAAELNIEKNVNNLVKLTKRTGKLDEQVYGRATIAKDEMAEKPLFEETSENAEAPLAMEAAGVEQPVELPVESETVESSPIAIPAEIESEVASSDAEPVESELPAAVALAEENEELPASEPVEDAEMQVSEIATEPETAEPESVEVAAESDSEPAIEAESVEETEEPVAVAKEIENEKIDGSEFLDEEYSESAEFGTIVSDEPELEFLDQEKIAENESLENAETYAPIVLVPASENPPAVLEKSEELALAETESLSADVSAETDLKNDEVIQLEVKVSENTIEDTADKEKNALDAFIVPSLSDLQKGKYYVQIAMMNDEENIVSLLNTYRTNYPMVAVPLSNKKGYQIMVGPLERDEYGSVRQKFKERGFKDCFLRKIK
ncbi:MAG: SPOR domain-containing protein [Spirochaetia bacterium]|nr:SPOR domain-containing protein [Spirochaetia bacterium]